MLRQLYIKIQIIIIVYNHMDINITSLLKRDLFIFLFFVFKLLIIRLLLLY